MYSIEKILTAVLTLAFLFLIFLSSSVNKTHVEINEENKKENTIQTESIKIQNIDKSISKIDTSNEKTSTFGSSLKNCMYGTCWGRTSQGYRCNNCAKSGSSYCGTHGKQDLFNQGYRYNTTCSAIASSTGRQCRNKAKSGSMYCSRHSY